MAKGLGAGSIEVLELSSAMSIKNIINNNTLMVYEL